MKTIKKEQDKNYKTKSTITNKNLPNGFNRRLEMAGGSVNLKTE